MKTINRLWRFEGKGLLVANIETNIWHTQKGRNAQSASGKCGPSCWDTAYSWLRHWRVSPCVTVPLMTQTASVSKSRHSHGLDWVPNSVT
jgi:hypothetical protein